MNQNGAAIAGETPAGGAPTRLGPASLAVLAELSALPVGVHQDVAGEAVVHV